jgi:hypothetical protein
VFGLGTIAGMMLISMSMAVPLALTALRSTKLERSLLYGSGVISLVFGIFIVLRIAFWDRLF